MEEYRVCTFLLYNMIPLVYFSPRDLGPCGEGVSFNSYDLPDCRDLRVQYIICLSLLVKADSGVWGRGLVLRSMQERFGKDAEMFSFFVSKSLLERGLALEDW
jgi:hypothetical protein